MSTDNQRGVHARAEAAIVINGHRLTEAQSTTVRVAINQFASLLHDTVDWQAVAHDLAGFDSETVTGEAVVAAEERLQAAVDKRTRVHDVGSIERLYLDRMEEIGAMIVLVAGDSSRPRAEQLMRALEVWASSEVRWLTATEASRTTALEVSRALLVDELAALTGEGVSPCR